MRVSHCCIVLILVLASAMARAQQVYSWTTIAGSITAPAAIKDGTNGVARFMSPESIAVDGAGVLFVCDREANRVCEVRRIGADWVTTTISRGLERPSGIAVDRDGSLIVTTSSQYLARMRRTAEGWGWSLFMNAITNRTG